MEKEKRKMSDEHKKKLSDFRKSLTGKINHTQETKEKIAKANTGKIFSNERKKAIGDANTFKPDRDALERLRLIANENVCGIDACLEEAELLDKKRGRKFYTKFIKENTNWSHKLLFYNKKITFNDGKMLCDMLRLNMHPIDIAKKISLNMKTFYGSCEKMKVIHNINYDPIRKNRSYNAPTKPEVFVSNILDKNEIKYTREFDRLGKFFWDFRINNTQLLIEVQGDYWHANPRFYPDGPKNKTQKTNVKRDNFKRKYAKDLGFFTLYIWENDIKNKPGEIEEILLKYTRIAYEKASNNEITV